MQRVSVVIPTYRRERVLIETISYLLALQPAPNELLIVDQTAEHESSTKEDLNRLHHEGKIRWIRLPSPSITRAMNAGLEQADYELVLFLDDDIIPDSNLIIAHVRAQMIPGCNIVAGQVLQPGETPVNAETGEGRFRFCSNQSAHISELMGGNFSINRDLAIRLGGFDENFIHVAYRFESEFAARALAAGEKILFEPAASIRHLKSASGGTRSYGDHLTTFRPSHSVGEYYFLLSSKNTTRRLQKIAARPFRSIRTSHHLAHPWWIPGTLIGEVWGFLWAAYLKRKGPRLIGRMRGDGAAQLPDGPSIVASRES